MGFSIAEKLADTGNRVILVSGPSYLNVSHSNIKCLKVISAQEMYEACIQNYKNVDAAILAAAVADYTPETKSREKIKKSSENLVLKLKPTKDIAYELGKIKKKDQLLVGFALETDNEFENARAKLKKKNMDFIVVNSLKDKGAGFLYDTNKISIIDRKDNIKRYELKRKNEVAGDIIDFLFKHLR